jgi:uncharacterized protein with von Willebrand factor type A (vWA) domain
MSARKVRADCKYDADELREIRPFKADFVAGTIPQRMALLKSKILPAMFNYWQELGKEYDSQESKAISKVLPINKKVLDHHFKNLYQELTQWCANNWRMVHGRPKSNKFRIRLIDVLWKCQQDLVMEEMSQMREDGRTGGDFELRTAASKNVIAKMTEKELNDLNKAAKDMKKNGYTEEHKRR